MMREKFKSFLRISSTHYESWRVYLYCLLMTPFFMLFPNATSFVWFVMISSVLPIRDGYDLIFYGIGHVLSLNISFPLFLIWIKVSYLFFSLEMHPNFFPMFAQTYYYMTKVLRKLGFRGFKHLLAHRYDSYIETAILMGDFMMYSVLGLTIDDEEIQKISDMREDMRPFLENHRCKKITPELDETLQIVKSLTTKSGTKEPVPQQILTGCNLSMSDVPDDWIGVYEVDREVNTTDDEGFGGDVRYDPPGRPVHYYYAKSNPETLYPERWKAVIEAIPPKDDTPYGFPIPIEDSSFVRKIICNSEFETHKFFPDLLHMYEVRHTPIRTGNADIDFHLKSFETGRVPRVSYRGKTSLYNVHGNYYLAYSKRKKTNIERNSYYLWGFYNT